MAINLSFVMLTVFGIQFAQAMDCSLGTSKNVIEQLIRTCPRPLIDSEQESYCCWSPSGDRVTCCNLTDFVFNSISIMLPLIIIGLVVSFIVSCVCCLCCPCCCFYRKRSGGRVIRQGPMLVTVGPYAVPPTSPYQPLSDGRNGWTVA
ncbi:uncharacterized protein LOC128996533 isoform X2 [Macrosteles quadrilineatus]|uniref:uncharacterized protein LOC128996533 isoform X2 n=1 Tax=Macrosteles quadrilineatus TaxID=74068 RepID=UPI0023E196A0|nr:uncharacterized protein LOC128996533 isoform X2 [Macrosteles quadrilineatus]